VIAGEPLAATRERRGDFGVLIREATGASWAGEWREVDGRGSVPLPLLPDVAGLIVTGSAASVTSREPWMLRLEEYLRAAVAQRVPTLGICFGHQLLGQALGGRVEKNPRGREIGTVRVQISEPDWLFSQASGEFAANSTHVDSIIVLPDGARVLASTELDPHAAVRFGEHVYGVQFHPEVDGEVMLDYLNARGQILLEEGANPDTLRAAVKDAPESAAILGRFAETLTLTERAQNSGSRRA
jgi:GMP synthase (glutamine-hydrolysing)